MVGPYHDGVCGRKESLRDPGAAGALARAPGSCTLFSTAVECRVGAHLGLLLAGMGRGAP